MGTEFGQNSVFRGTETHFSDDRNTLFWNSETNCNAPEVPKCPTPKPGRPFGGHLFGKKTNTDGPKSGKTDPQKGTTFREQELTISREQKRTFCENRTALFETAEVHFLDQQGCTPWSRMDPNSTKTGPRNGPNPAQNWIQFSPNPVPKMIQIRLKLVRNGPKSRPQFDQN